MVDVACRSCGYEGLVSFLRLGNVPPVNAFISESEKEAEKKYPLNLAYCPHCFLVQLEEIVPPEVLFRNYLHMSAGSPSNVQHLQEVAATLCRRFAIDAGKTVLDIGGNDGTLLSFFKKHTSRVIDVDPALNLKQANEEKGIEYIAEFFNTRTASRVVREKGKMDLIVALNVIPHTPNNIDLLKAVRIALKDEGTLVMEGVYALETILNGEFDTIYHEHVYTFSFHSLISTFRMAGLTVVDVEKIPVQGGSLRIFAMKDENALPPSPAVAELLAQEKKEGFSDENLYKGVGPKVLGFRQRLRALIDEEKKAGGKLIGLGAPARGVVIMNYCSITPRDIEFILDDTPLKIGRFAPGVHVPIASWDALKSADERTFLLLSWNYKENIISRLKQRVKKARVIVPFPALEVITFG